MVEAVIDWFVFNGWTQVGIIYINDAYGQGILTELGNAGPPKGINAVFAPYDDPSDAETVLDALDGMRVYFVIGWDDLPLPLLQSATKRGLISDEHVRLCAESERIRERPSDASVPEPSPGDPLVPVVGELRQTGRSLRNCGKTTSIRARDRGAFGRVSGASDRRSALAQVWIFADAALSQDALHDLFNLDGPDHKSLIDGAARLGQTGIVPGWEPWDALVSAMRENVGRANATIEASDAAGAFSKLDTEYAAHLASEDASVYEISSFAFDAVAAFALGACASERRRRLDEAREYEARDGGLALPRTSAIKPSGPEIKAAIVDLDFAGASGRVRFDAFGTRAASSVSITVVNYYREDDGGNSREVRAGAEKGRALPGGGRHAERERLRRSGRMGKDEADVPRVRCTRGRASRAGRPSTTPGR